MRPSVPVPLRLLLVAALLAPSAVSATTVRLDTARAYIRTGQLAVSPGDTVCIEPGRRLYQYIRGIHGSAEHPIVVSNCPGGRVLIGTTHHFGLFFDSVSYIHVTGGLDPNFPYGIHIDGTAAGSGVSVTGNSHHVEIDHLEISGTNFAGIMVKQDFGGAPPDPLPLFPGLSIHHNRIHDTGGEGMYLGETKSPGMLFSEVEVHHNLLLRTGWDGLQASNMDGVRLHHNVLVDLGAKNELYQANGIQIGNNVKDLRVDHNVVVRSNENSLNILGGGASSIDSNWFEGAHGPQTLFIDDRTFADTGATIAIRDNFWHRTTTLAWKNYDQPNPVVLQGNRIDPVDTLIVYAAGAGPSTTTLSGNIQQTLADLAFADSAQGDFRIAAASPYAAWELGFGTAWSSGVARRSSTAAGIPKSTPVLRPGSLPMDIPHPLGRRVPTP